MDDKFINDLMQPQDDNSFYKEMVDKRIEQDEEKKRKENIFNKFMQDTAHLESSSGTNFNHDQINSGIHKGHRAAGTYGIMPNTAQEIINRKKMNKEDISAFSEIDNNADPAFVKQYIESNPEIERALAESLANKVLNATDYDTEKAQYMWQYGHNLPIDRVNKEYENSDRVQKYRKTKKQLTSK